MKNILKITIILASVFVLLNGCVKEDFDTTPEYITDWEDNISIADLKEMYNGSAVEIDTALIIKGRVVSNGENGNFYKILFIEGETGAIVLNLDDSYLHEKYPVGRLVYVKCEGLYIDKRYNYDYFELGLTPEINRINSSLIEDYIDISEGINIIEPKVMKLDEIINVDSLLGTYVKFEDVQFNNPKQTYVTGSEPYGERTIVDCNDNQIILSTSSYVNFGTDSLPTGNGSIKAVFSKYGETYQLRINSPNDIDFTGERCSN